MPRKTRHLLFLAIFSFLLPTAASFAEDIYIAVTGDVVNVRAEPSTESLIVAKAVRGDIFQVVSEEGDWYAVSLFSGEPRYIFKPITRETFYEINLPIDRETIKAIYRAVVRSENRALDEAAAACSGDVVECVRMERYLSDKYTLQLFHRFGLQPPCYHYLIVEAAKNSLLQ